MSRKDTVIWAEFVIQFSPEQHNSEPILLGEDPHNPSPHLTQINKHRFIYAYLKANILQRLTIKRWMGNFLYYHLIFVTLLLISKTVRDTSTRFIPDMETLQMH